MNQLVTLGVVILAVFAGLSSATIECYQCTGKIDETLTERDPYNKDVAIGCSSLSITTTGDKFDYCTTKYTTTSTGDSEIVRGGGINSPGEKETNKCDSSGMCTCTDNKCNDEKVTAKTTLTCYECTSSNYFDNGCGEELKQTKYVHKVTGCSACGKTVSVSSNNFATTYTRGCVRAVQVEDECFGDEGEATGRTCICQESLCNSAHAIHFTAFSLLSTLLVFITKF